MKQTDLGKKEWAKPEDVEPSTMPAPAAAPPKFRVLLLSLSLVLVAALLAWLLLFPKTSPSPVPDEVTQTREIKEELNIPPAPEANLNETSITPQTVHLDDSDDPVRIMAAALSGQKKLAGLLQETGLIRRFVAVVNALAMGESPAPMLESLAPRHSFMALKEDGRWTIDPASHHRYDELMALLLSLKPETACELYLSFEPQIEAAHRELGSSGGESFFLTLERAVALLRTTPLPPERAELVEQTLSYAYADPELEALNAAQKQFMRLGSNHLQQLQGKITLMMEPLRRHKNR